MKNVERFREAYESSSMLLVPKGENLDVARRVLARAGVYVPAPDGRSLHQLRKWR